MADFGLSKGLTFKIPASEYVDREINDMKYAEQMRRQQEAVDMAKAKLLADDFEMIAGSNPVDAEIIKNSFYETSKRLGDIANKNPNWHTDPNSLMQVNALKGAYKSSDDVIRSTIYKNSMDNYIKFKAEAAKNPTRYNMDELAVFENELKSYNGSKPLVFTSPRELQDLDKIETEAASQMDPDEYKRWNNGNKGAFIGSVSDKNLYKKAASIYANNEYDYNYRYKGQKDIDIIGVIAKRLGAGSKTDIHYGEVDKLQEAKELELFKARLAQGQSNKAESLYDKSFRNTAYIRPGHEILAEVYTTNPPAYYIDINGKKVDISDDPFNYNGVLEDKGVRFDDDRNVVGGGISGIKIAPGHINKPLDWAKQSGYIYDPVGPSGQGKTDFEVKPEHKGKGEIAFDKDNNPYFKLYATAEIDGNLPVYKNRVDKRMTANQRNAAGIETEGESSTQEVYTNNKTGEKFIKTGNGYQKIQ